LTSIAGDAELGVIVGLRGRVLVSEGTGPTWRSADGTTTNDLFGLCFGGGRFVAVGKGAILVSENGRHWQSAVTPVSSLSIYPLLRVIYWNGRYWAISQSELLTSDDGMVWEARRISGVSSQMDLTGHNGSLVLLGNGSAQVLSNEAELDPLRGSSPPFRLTRLISDGQALVGVGDSPSPGFTLNRVNWFTRETDQPWGLQGIRSLRGSLYAVGTCGVIVRSAPLAQLGLKHGPTGVELGLNPTDGREFRLEHASTPDGRDGWRAFGPASGRPEGGGVVWTDSEAGSVPQRFYRAVLDE
jgi:hypothetical protein